MNFVNTPGLGKKECSFFNQLKILVMKLVPVFRCSDMHQALDFYTNILEFELSYPETEENPVVLIKKDDIEIQLSIFDGGLNTTVNVWLDEVDNLFAKYLERGLDPSHKKNSPVHQGPIDQTWGMREFYVTDQDGNTLRFGRPLKQ